jgi:NAD(P)-dependent dehydrogenase (short-subunit alcohol dehydrogenase family)
MDLAGQVAIVTGGGRRLGQAICLALAEAGASVLVHYSRSADEAQGTLAKINALGREGACVGADFQNPTVAAPKLIDAACQRFGRADILVNSAAIFQPSSLAATTEADWDRHFAVNLKAPAFLCREFAARHQSGRPAAIVNIADWRGLRPVPGHFSYTLTKAGIVALTRLLALELAPDIRVNAVAPGAILPPPGATPKFLARLAQHVPLKRHGEPSDVTDAVLYLLRSDFVTGDVLCVTGGEDLL